MYAEDETFDDKGPPVVAPFLFSLILHLLLIFTLLRFNPVHEIAPETFEVTVDWSPKTERKNQQAKQIISPPQNQTPSSDDKSITKFLSDVETHTDREQVKRGDEGGGVPGAPQLQQQPIEKKVATKQETQPHKAETQKAEKVVATPQEPKQHVAHATTIPFKQLTLDSSTVMETLSRDAEKKQQEQKNVTDSNQGARPTELEQYQAFSRPTGTGATVLGIPGTRDYLPGLPDGDMTFLNAKAARYAVFIRRVATQVFSLLRNSGWENLSMRDIQAITDFTTVQAVLSIKGDLLSVTLSDPSGSVRFDQLMQTVVKQGARDPNPPASAATADGNIHLTFMARSWSKMGVNSRSGGAVEEQRWLLLATGLD